MLKNTTIFVNYL